MHQRANKKVISPEAIEEYRDTDLDAAVNNFAHYRVLMNPRFTLKKKWFPRSLAKTLRAFYDDMKAGKRPVLLLQTPPQHGKSLTVIDFIAWCIGHDPELRVIYASFSDRLSIRANLRVQRALDNPLYQIIFPNTRIAPKGSSYEVGVEQEPGSGGKESAESTIRNLRGFKVYADKVTGSKEVRAEPFAAQVQGSNVSMVAGIYQNDLLDEMVSFPNGKYRDQVDACSGAFNRLISGPVYNLFGGAVD
jgi:predicted phage terminase large subunit-like protein